MEALKTKRIVAIAALASIITVMLYSSIMPTQETALADTTFVTASDVSPIGVEQAIRNLDKEILDKYAMRLWDTNSTAHQPGHYYLDFANHYGDLNVVGDANFANLSISENTFLNNLIAVGDSNFLNIGVSEGTYLNRLVATGDSNFASIGVSQGAHLNYVIATGDLNVLGDIYVDGNIFGNVPYFQSWEDIPTGETLTFATANVWYWFDLSKNPTLNGFNVSDQNIVAEKSGLYEFIYSAEGSGQNNHTYITTIAINDANKDACISRKTLAAGGDIIPMDGGCFLNIAAGDVIRLWVMDWGGTGAGTIYHYNLRAKRIGN